MVICFFFFFSTLLYFWYQFFASFLLCSLYRCRSFSHLKVIVVKVWRSISVEIAKPRDSVQNQSKVWSKDMKSNNYCCRKIGWANFIDAQMLFSSTRIEYNKFQHSQKSWFHWLHFLNVFHFEPTLQQYLVSRYSFSVNSFSASIFRLCCGGFFKNMRNPIAWF